MPRPGDGVLSTIACGKSAESGDNGGEPAPDVGGARELLWFGTGDPDMKTAQRDDQQPPRTCRSDVARAMIVEATEVITSTRSSSSERVAAYRRRARAWTRLAENLPDDSPLGFTMLHAAADDWSRARHRSAHDRDDVCDAEIPSHQSG
jgi:hypothetical protein